MQRSALLSVVSCALALGGCIERRGGPIGPNLGYGQEVQIGGAGVSTVDVLFVIDNSGSMRQEQANLATQIPTLVRDLASPPLDAAGQPLWNAAEQLRIGITTTDVGIGGVMIDRSGCAEGGDDGALRGGVYEWRAGGDADAFAARVRATVESLGIAGCAFEQPLEAAARVVARAPDTGFPSDGGLLAVIVVTDEEDCSVQDDAAFFTGMDPATYNVHCGRYRDRLTPLPELLASIRGARDEREFVFAAIAGLPVDLPAGITPDELLARPEMQFREDAMARPEPVAVCGSDADLGKAYPARRLVELARLVPETVLTTICTDDFGPAIAQIGAHIGMQIPGVCLVREVPRGIGSRVPCEVEVTLPPSAGCLELPGYAFVALDGDREVCEVDQVPGGAGSGWYYDPTHEACAQLVLTVDARPPVGAAIRAECFFALELELGELCARSSQCGSGWCDPVTDACAPLPGPQGPATGA